MSETVFSLPHVYDTSKLAHFFSRSERIFPNNNNRTPDIPANALTSLHINTKSFVEIREWHKKAILVVCPERTYPYEVRKQGNRIVINEKSYRPKGTITIFAPPAIDFLNLTLHDDAVCVSHIKAHLASVTTSGTSHAHIRAEHLFAQNLETSHINVKMIPRVFNRSGKQRLGQIVALFAGDSFKIDGMYENSIIAFSKAQTLLHPGHADRMTAYLLPTSRTERKTEHGPIIRFPKWNQLDKRLLVQDLNVTSDVFRKTMGQYLSEMITNTGIQP